MIVEPVGYLGRHAIRGGQDVGIDLEAICDRRETERARSRRLRVGADQREPGRSALHRSQLHLGEVLRLVDDDM